MRKQLLEMEFRTIVSVTRSQWPVTFEEAREVVTERMTTLLTDGATGQVKGLQATSTTGALSVTSKVFIIEVLTTVVTDTEHFAQVFTHVETQRQIAETIQMRLADISHDGPALRATAQWRATRAVAAAR